MNQPAPMREAKPWFFDDPAYEHSLRTASRWGCKNTVVELIENGAVIDARGGSFDRTALHEASMSNQFEITAILLQYGANIEISDDGGWTALHCAVHHAGVECASVLLDNGANIWKRSDFNHTPLHWCKNIDMFTLLISKMESRPRSKTELDILHSVLDDAIRDGKLEIVRMLLYDIVGIDIKRKNARGVCAVVTSKRCDHQSIKDLVEFRLHEIEMARSEMCVSFAMGSAKRLGDESLIQSLDEGVVQMILLAFLEM
jgi:ankyrin repeat protein